MCKAFSHTFYNLVMREPAEKGSLRPAAKATANNGAGYNACDEGNEDQHQHRKDRGNTDTGKIAQLVQLESV